MDYKELIGIARQIGMERAAAALEAINLRASKGKDADLILPLVGEFSSGKTSLVDALTDSHCLEIATRPTTATLYEIHFGAERCRAIVTAQDGTEREVADTEALRNDVLADARVVTVYDTSRRVASHTVLVDTPGISSPDIRHKEALVAFLPNADGVLLVSDINQQLTRSLTDFAASMMHTDVPLYLVLTKSDTKSEEDVKGVRRYIAENTKLNVKGVAVVSAQNGELGELDSMLAEIQSHKQEIVMRVDASRVRSLAAQMITRIDELIRAMTGGDNTQEEALHQQQESLERLKHTITRTMEQLCERVEGLATETTESFGTEINDRLMAIATEGGGEVDLRVRGEVNTLASLMLSQFRNRIGKLFMDSVKENWGKNQGLALESLTQIDLSTLGVSEIDVNLALSGISGTTVARTIRSSSKEIGTIASCVLQVIPKVGSVAKAVGGKVIEWGGELIGSVIGSLVENTVSKPKRKQMVREFINNELKPRLNGDMHKAAAQVQADMQKLLCEGAEEAIAEKNLAIKQLMDEISTQKMQKQERQARMTEMRKTLEALL